MDFYRSWWHCLSWPSIWYPNYLNKGNIHGYLTVNEKPWERQDVWPKFLTYGFYQHPNEKKRKRLRRPAFATPIGSAVLPSPTPVDVEEEEEEPLLLPTPTTETPLQLPTTPEETPFKPPNQGKEKRGKRLLPTPVMMTRSKRQQKGTGLGRTILHRHWITY